MSCFLIFFTVVAQTYTTDAHKTYVILGNSALVKCEIPSFVADFVSVVSWIDNDQVEYFPSNLGTSYCISIGALHKQFVNIFLLM